MKWIIKLFIVLLFLLSALLLTSYFLLNIFSKEKTFSINQNNISLFAHKCCPDYYPENSIGAYKNSLKNGFDNFEIDIQRTKDDIYVLFHDFKLNDKFGIKGQISDYNYSDIYKYKIVHKGESFNIERLDLFLLSLGDSVIVYLDVKIVDNAFTDAMLLIKEIKKLKAEKKCLIASHNILFILFVRLFSNEIVTVLEGIDSGEESILYLINKFIKPDYYSGFADETDIEHIEWLRNNNLIDKRFVFGLEKGQLNFFINKGIKNFIVDCSDEVDSVMINKLK